MVQQNFHVLAALVPVDASERRRMTPDQMIKMATTHQAKLAAHLRSTFQFHDKSAKVISRSAWGLMLFKLNMKKFAGNTTMPMSRLVEGYVSPLQISGRGYEVVVQSVEHNHWDPPHKELMKTNLHRTLYRHGALPKGKTAAPKRKSAAPKRKSAAPKRKRCPRGSRRNPKTGKCKRNSSKPRLSCSGGVCRIVRS